MRMVILYKLMKDIKKILETPGEKLKASTIAGFILQRAYFTVLGNTFVFLYLLCMLGIMVSLGNYQGQEGGGGGWFPYVSLCWFAHSVNYSNHFGYNGLSPITFPCVLQAYRSNKNDEGDANYSLPRLWPLMIFSILLFPFYSIVMFLLANLYWVYEVFMDINFKVISESISFRQSL